jgi:hypothetical protein
VLSTNGGCMIKYALISVFSLFPIVAVAETIFQRDVLYDINFSGGLSTAVTDYEIFCIAAGIT